MIESGAMPAWSAALVGIAAGLVIGIVFFGGLRLTLERLAGARRPAVLILASFVVRIGLAVAVLVALARWTGWAGLVAGAAGMLAVRSLLVRHARSAIDTPNAKARR